MQPTDEHKRLEKVAREARKMYHSDVPLSRVRKMVDVRSMRELQRLLTYKHGKYYGELPRENLEVAFSYILHLLDEAEQLLHLHRERK